jgi:hypothetical protein
VDRVVGGTPGPLDSWALGGCILRSRDSFNRRSLALAARRGVELTQPTPERSLPVPTWLAEVDNFSTSLAGSRRPLALPKSVLNGEHVTPLPFQACTAPHSGRFQTDVGGRFS